MRREIEIDSNLMLNWNKPTKDKNFLRIKENYFCEKAREFHSIALRTNKIKLCYNYFLGY